MARVDDKGNWIDAAGNKVPRKYVSTVDRARDRMVTKLIKRARKIRADLAAFRALVDQEAGAFLDGEAAEAGLQRNKGGNYTFTDFSGIEQIEIKQVDFDTFDERLKLAKQIIDECLERWADGARGELRAIVFDAFQVNKKGLIDARRVRRLLKLKIEDRQWLKAMQLITDSMQVGARRAYVQLRERQQRGEWKTIRLDLAAFDTGDSND